MSFSRPPQHIVEVWNTYATTDLCTADLQYARQLGIQHSRIALMKEHAEALRQVHDLFKKAKLRTISGPEIQLWYAAFVEGFDQGSTLLKADLMTEFSDDFERLISDRPIHNNIAPQLRLVMKECGCKIGTGCEKYGGNIRLHGRKHRILLCEGKLKTRVSRKSLVVEIFPTAISNSLKSSQSKQSQWKLVDSGIEVAPLQAASGTL